MSKPSEDSRLERDDGESQSRTDPDVKEEKKEDTPTDEEKKLLDGEENMYKIKTDH